MRCWAAGLRNDCAQRLQECKLLAQLLASQEIGQSSATGTTKLRVVFRRLALISYSSFGKKLVLNLARVEAHATVNSVMRNRSQQGHAHNPDLDAHFMMHQLSDTPLSALMYSTYQLLKSQPASDLSGGFCDSSHLLFIMSGRRPSVFARVKPRDAATTSSLVVHDAKTVTILNQALSFSLSAAKEHADQAEVFEDAKPTVEAAVDGINATIFTWVFRSCVDCA